jgi:hypothetical protein
MINKQSAFSFKPKRNQSIFTIYYDIIISSSCAVNMQFIDFDRNFVFRNKCLKKHISIINYTNRIVLDSISWIDSHLLENALSHANNDPRLKTKLIPVK